MDFSEIKELKSIFTQKKFCYPISELDNDGGYADISFLRFAISTR